MPHVNAVHGYVPIDERGHYEKQGREFVAARTPRFEPAHPAYAQQMQSILIFVPESFVRRLHEGRRASWDRREDAADALYQDSLKKIIAALWSLFEESFRGALPVGTVVPMHESFVAAQRDLERWVRSDEAFPQYGREVTPSFEQ
jgi:hypothetical protein